MNFAKDASELLDPEDLANLSGFEFISGIASGKFPQPPICETLNFRMTEAEKGRVVFRGQPKFSALNPLGTIHGGWFGALLDSCMACAVQSTLPKGTGYTTLEFKINILKALREGDEEVEAVGETIHVGRRTGVASGKLIGVSSGKVYAHGSTTCIVLQL